MPKTDHWYVLHRSSKGMPWCFGHLQLSKEAATTSRQNFLAEGQEAVLGFSFPFTLVR